MFLQYLENLYCRLPHLINTGLVFLEYTAPGIVCHLGVLEHIGFFFITVGNCIANTHIIDEVNV